MEEKKSKIGIIIGVIVLILVLGVGGYFLFFNKPKKDNTTPPPADTPAKEVKEPEKYSNKVLMECPLKAKASQEIECSIKMQYLIKLDNKFILYIVVRLDYLIKKI